MSAKILIVDDEPGVQNAARRILSRQYEVNGASSGHEALARLTNEPHDLAIVDVRMPGMNGFELLKAIKADYPDTEVIVMTGSISNPDEKLVEALRERAFYFIHKPFERAVLETLVARCLERQRLERENRDYTAALEADLEQARRFQRLLLPKALPRVPGLQGEVHFEPSERLSGDFYDFYVLEGGRLGVLIADVSGHGVSAALYTGMVKSEMQAVPARAGAPGELFEQINESLRMAVSNRFVTALLVLVDPASRKLRYVSAGHLSFLTSDGRAWESTGPPLGMLPGSRYEVRDVDLGPGERLLLYTDGLSEAMNNEGADFGCERVEAAFASTRSLPPAEAVRAIVEAARRFAGRSGFADDASAIVLQLEP